MKDKCETVIPRSEFPNPQFERKNWLCLNGEWDFRIDKKNRISASIPEKFDKKIVVPFCPQSRLSGVQYTNFMYSIWYRRNIEINRENLTGKVILHFGAVDYRAEAFINGKSVCTHTGGYVPFKTDITDFLTEGTNTIVLHATDDERDPLIPRGKQCEKLKSCVCDYTRTTGIWQSVWLEFVPCDHIESFRLYPDIHTPSVTVSYCTCGVNKLDIEVTYEGRPVGTAHIENAGESGEINIPLSEKQLWETGNGRLYDVKLTFGDDTVYTYFGLREISFDKFKFLLNGKSVFQRLVLDQGFYPDGIYTAPNDDELRLDIVRSLDCGFNGARLHQKIFEPRFLYYADKAGYLVWGEYPCWGIDYSNPYALQSVLPEWLEEIERDFNHPSIIGWCPFNETWDYKKKRRQDDNLLRLIYRVTKSADKTRPCIDTSGNYHVETDIFDVHDYNQNVDIFKERYDDFAVTGKIFTHFPDRQQQKTNQPAFLSEYGGIKWSPDRNDGWGYGDSPKTEEEFILRFKGLTDALLDNPNMMGLCYTQLTDIEQEQNGLYTYERKAKFDTKIFKDILSRRAAIE